MNRQARLIQLSSQLDQVLEFRVLPDGTEVDENGNPIARVAGAGIVGGGVAAGGYYGNRAVQAAGGYRKVAGDLGTRAGAAVAPVAERGANFINTVGNAGERGFKRESGSLVQKLLRALKGAGKTALHTRFQSREDRLVQLSADLDEVIEFSKKTIQ